MSSLSSDPSLTSQSGWKEALALAEKLNAVLILVPNRDWNYSRVHLVVRDLEEIGGPYALGCDWIDVQSKTGRQQLEELERERTWGARHSDDLGFMEVVSLRLNQALFRGAEPENKTWEGMFPVVRVVKRETLRAAASPVGFWYEIEEVDGEEFDRRGGSSGGG